MVIIGVKTFLVVTTVVIESSVFLVSVILADLAVEVVENTAKIEDFSIVWSGVLQVSNVFIEFLQFPFESLIACRFVTLEADSRGTLESKEPNGKLFLEHSWNFTAVLNYKICLIFGIYRV